MTRYDAVIIGGGAIGLSTALRLAQQDNTLSIAIISPNNIEGSASIAAGAMLGCYGEVTKSTLANPHAKAKFELSLTAEKQWSEWLQMLNQYVKPGQQLEVVKGSHIILNSDSGELDSENFDAIIQALNEYQQPYEEVHPKHIKGFEPIDSSRSIRTIYVPNEDAIDSEQLIKALFNACQMQPNITYIHDAALSLKVNAGNIQSVTTVKNQEYVSPQIILAAGSVNQQLIDTVAEIRTRVPRTFAGVGVSILLEGECLGFESTIRTSNRSFACGLHAVPRSQGRYYLGATNNVELQSESLPRLGSTHFLMQSGMDQINQRIYRSHVARLTVGNRPVSMDTFPLLGQTSVKGLWIVGGTYREGLQQSPYLSSIVADAILQNKPNQYLDLFTPERMPINTLTKDEAIKESVNHYISGAYEHKMQLPRLGYN